MKTGALVLALTMAGVVGGAAGALLVQAGSDSPAAAPSPGAGRASGDASADERRAKESADLRNRVEVLEANLGNAVQETSRLREELAAATKASGEARERLAALETRPAGGEAGAVASALQRMQEAQRAVAIEGAPIAISGFGERFKKMSELRALPPEERWAKAREALGLTTTQEEELKAAIRERDEGMQEVVKAAMQAREDAARDGAADAARGRAFDLVKMQEVRRRYDDRVAQTLNADQQKKWREEGYDRAMGGGVDVVTSVRFDNAPAGK